MKKTFASARHSQNRLARPNKLYYNVDYVFIEVAMYRTKTKQNYHCYRAQAK